MGIATYPAAAGGGIKSVQRGLAGGAGNVTITAVDIAKSFVTVFGTASSGTVSASFNASLGNGNAQITGTAINDGAAGVNQYHWSPTSRNGSQAGASVAPPGTNTLFWVQTVAVNNGAFNVGGGSTNLVAAVVQGYLANSTTLTVSGACRYEVVEFA